jgi:hypothetical protein
MALESEYFPEQTYRSSSLSPADRRAYNRIIWGVFGFYTATVVITAAVVVGNANVHVAALLELAANRN